MPATDEQTEGSTATDGVFIWGDIVDNEMVVDLVGFINQCRRSVVLTVAQDGLRKSVYFRLGSLMAASSNLPEDRFGDIMFRRGLITRAQLDEALALVRPGRKIGNILMARGLISGEDLWKVLKVQIEEILFSVLLIESGEFTIAEYDAGQVPTRTALDTQHVLLEGLRRKDEIQHLRDELPDGETRVAARRDVDAERLDPSELTMLALVDGRRSVKDLLRDSGLGDFAATRALHRLLKTGLATTIAAPMSDDLETRPAVIIVAFNRAFERIHGTLGERVSNATLQAGFESFFNDAGGELQALFAGVGMSPNGRMNTAEVLRNLKQCQARNKNQLLGWGLRDYLRYLLFMAREALPYEQVEVLAADVSQMVDGF